METSMEVPPKITNRTTARPAGPLLGVCPEDVKSPSRSHVRTPGSLPHCSRRSRRGSKPSVHAGCSQRADVAHVTGYVHGRIRCPPGPTMAPGGVMLSRVRQRRGPYDLTRWWNRTKPHVQRRNAGGCRRCRGRGQRACTPSDKMNALGVVMYSTGPAAHRTAPHVCKGLSVGVESSHPPWVTVRCWLWQSRHNTCMYQVATLYPSNLNGGRCQ